jgi:hypothetical protein
MSPFNLSREHLAAAERAAPAHMLPIIKPCASDASSCSARSELGRSNSRAAASDP